jgi:hypothetical protein
MHGAHNHQSQSDAAQVVLVGISGRLTEVALQENLILQDNAMGYETDGCYHQKSFTSNLILSLLRTFRKI